MSLLVTHACLWSGYSVSILAIIQTYYISKSTTLLFYLSMIDHSLMLGLGGCCLAVWVGAVWLLFGPDLAFGVDQQNIRITNEPLFFQTNIAVQ